MNKLFYRTSQNQAAKYVTACAVLHNIGIDRGDIIDSTCDENVQPCGGIDELLVGDGVNMRNYVVDTYSS